MIPSKEALERLKKKNIHCPYITGPDSDGYYYCKECKAVAKDRKELQGDCPRS